LWEERPARYTRALLETMALIAYRQPITRGEIEEVRGVSVSSHIVKTLLERAWIKVLGHKDVPGKPTLYGTTKEFLDYFNLKSLDQLPTLADIKDLDSIHPELALDEYEQGKTSEDQAGEELSEQSGRDFEGEVIESLSTGADDVSSTDVVDEVSDANSDAEESDLSDEIMDVETQVFNV